MCSDACWKREKNTNNVLGKIHRYSMLNVLEWNDGLLYTIDYMQIPSDKFEDKGSLLDMKTVLLLLLITKNILPFKCCDIIQNAVR